MLKKILLGVGVLTCLTAFFANLLGIDHDTGWGNGRILILVLGILFITLGLFLDAVQNRIRKIQVRLFQFTNAVGRDYLIRAIFVVTAILIAIAYLWFLRLDERRNDIAYNYYSELAKGFKEGHLYLPQKPSERLMELSDPYDFVLRKQEGLEDFPWDVSLYEGRFYIYWGPTPALFLIPFSEGVLSKIEDYYLSLAFAYGLFIYSALLITNFWRRLKAAPIWLLTILLFVIGLSMPITTMIRRGEVYEASIFACQFFFIGGCYWAYSSLRDETPMLWKFAIIGIHWAFAIGARVIILPSVGFAVLMMFFPLFRTDEKKRLRLLLALVLPLLISGIALAWYNYARFDSIFEFGTRYQLTNVDYAHFKGMFSLQHLNGNLRVYFKSPLSFESKFPFISLVEYPESNDRVAGLIYIAPFIIMSLLPLFQLVKHKGRIAPDSADNRMLILFAGAILISAFIIFIFYFVTLRYTLDFLPADWLLIIFSIGLEFESLKEMQLGKAILSFAVIILASINIVTGILLATPKSGVTFMLNFLNSVSKFIGLR